MNRTIKAAELKPLVENRSAVVLDVRRKSDYDSDNARLPGAQWRDPEKIAEWSTSLPKDSDVVIYCVRGGSVSNSVVDHLQANGVRARFIEGGIEAWKSAGGETEPK
ncbi:sulfurtransferase [Sulfurifustis variabilis]|uniref:Sulfurtransferase n=1 Tax=Sulfurifustis variabilis TaxID=1675686 RepID=A0A1B4V8L4_9GAMM|nr:rhodanese-like domain-containing protein [Sulfurifustis variabilis]BAU47774.1 sulfurtransferase [Sulfurifustis variabilis]